MLMRAMQQLQVVTVLVVQKLVFCLKLAYRSSPEIGADESNAGTASCDCLGSAETRILRDDGICKNCEIC
jgi:hypothetical protein